MAAGKARSTPAGSAPANAKRERRRSTRIVHDDRGNARLEWVNVPPEPGHRRVTLSLEETRPVYRPEKGYDPYAKAAREPRKPPASAGEPERRTKRNLRGLSEWIKQMRRLDKLPAKAGKAPKRKA
ncbi:MAG: hypothetical protein ACRET2_04480 [Steroidobacteraceae bacterium]